MKKIKQEHLNQLADYTARLYEHPRLRHLFLELTLQCNEHCFHCGSSCTSEKKEELSLEEQVERIRAKRNGSGEWKERARRILNNVFLILAVCGVVTYSSGEEHHVNGMIIVGIAMAFKLVEIIIRIIR
jgi:hypothetical protein